MPLPMLAGEMATAFGALPAASAKLCGDFYPVAPVRAEPQLVCEVFEGEAALAMAAPAWRALEDAGGVPTPFQSLALAKAAARVHLAQGERPLIAVVREGSRSDGRPMALLAGVVGRQGGMSTLRFLGDPLIQYGDAVAAPDVEPRHLAAAWQALASPAHAGLVYLRKVRADARIAPLLRERTIPVAEEVAPFVGVSGETLRNARDERELRRFRRRLADLGEVRFAVLEGEAARPVLEEAIALKREWLRERDLASLVIGDRRWEAALVETARADDRAAGAASRAARLVVAALTVNGRSAAIEVGLVLEDTWHAYLGVTAPGFAKAGPGQVLMADTIAHCRAAGISVYDLLPPAQSYKQALANGSVTVNDYALALSAAGRATLWAAQRLPAPKDMLAAMPAPLRRLVLRLALGTAAPAIGKN